MSATGQIEDYDLVILGSGAGSKMLTRTFAGRGQRVAAGLSRRPCSRLGRV